MTAVPAISITVTTAPRERLTWARLASAPSAAGRTSHRAPDCAACPGLGEPGG